jgi:hypothetical protein
MFRQGKLFSFKRFFRILSLLLLYLRNCFPSHNVSIVICKNIGFLINLQCLQFVVSTIDLFDDVLF